MERAGEGTSARRHGAAMEVFLLRAFGAAAAAGVDADDGNAFATVPDDFTK